MDNTINRWRTVARDGLPKYQPDVTYIGINSAGFAACFTVVEPDGSCWMHTGEESICVMSELHDWSELDRPARGVDAARAALDEAIANYDQPQEFAPELVELAERALGVTVVDGEPICTPPSVPDEKDHP